MDALTASEARANLYRLIGESFRVAQASLVITGKRGSAVLVSAEDWDAMQETLYLLSVPGMRESIKAGMADRYQRARRNLSGDLAGRLLAKQALNKGRQEELLCPRSKTESRANTGLAHA